jgi:hypothetical protein
MATSYVSWPVDVAPLRDDELALFAFCRLRWPDDPWALHGADEYADCATFLNDGFGKQRGWRYTAAALQQHLQQLRTNHRYQVHGRQKRYNHYWPQVKARLDEFRAIFGLQTRVAYRMLDHCVVACAEQPVEPMSVEHHQPELSWRDTKKTLAAGESGVVRMNVEFDDGTCGELVKAQQPGRKPRDCAHAHNTLNPLLHATGKCFNDGYDGVMEHILKHMRSSSRKQRSLRQQLVKKGINKAKTAMRQQQQRTAHLRVWSALQV